MAAATTAASGSEVSEGPVLTVITKRLRALRKKQNRILQMEESLAQGKVLNNEQQEVLRSKPGVVALIEELEKLRQPLSAAAAEEVSLATSHLSATDAAAPNGAAEETEKKNKSSDVSGGGEGKSEVEELLKLLYFGSMFDVKSQSDFTSIMLTRSHERSCCITYDTVTDDDTDLLSEKDLDLISSLSGLLISRPVDSSLSHQNALQRCIEHAKLWLANSDQQMEPNASVTYASLRERLSKIMSSAYFTITPEIRAPKEMPAAAGGNFSPFQVRIGDMDASFVLQQHKDEEAPSHHQGLVTVENQSGVEELQKDEVETEYPAEVILSQQEQVQYETEAQHNEREGEFEQQNGLRRQYQNQKGGHGGVRRGFSNGRGGGGRGRGGGPYQNGRNQFYDQPGNYYPRNYSRGRGGRGNGAAYNNHGPAAQDGHTSANIGVAS